jgi:hypothetical protein
MEMRNRPDPLESLVLKHHCEMCGARKGEPYLEPAFDPCGQPMTLCRDCRIGSSELIVERWAFAQQASGLLSRVVRLYWRGHTVQQMYAAMREAKQLIARAKR